MSTFSTTVSFEGFEAVEDVKLCANKSLILIFASRRAVFGRWRKGRQEQWCLPGLQTPLLLQLGDAQLPQEDSLRQTNSEHLVG